MTRMSLAIAMSILRRLLALLLGERLELDPAELGDAVDEFGDLVPEALADLRELVRGVLDHVVQERRLERRRIEVELGENQADLDGVLDEGLAGLADLALVSREREVIRVVEPGEVGVRIVRPDLRLYLLDRRWHLCLLASVS
jgi:hypothetical protein